MKKWILSMALALPLFGQEVLVNKSPFSFEDTLKAIEMILKKNGMSVFAKIDHRDSANKVGLSMGEGIVYIFGNPRGGTSLMQENPMWVLDLPLKVAVYQGKDKVIYISVFDLVYIAKRNKVSNEQMPKIVEMSKILKKILNVQQDI